MIQLKINITEKSSRPLYSDMAYNIYGIWMQALPAHYAELLHSNSARPINQHLLTNRLKPDEAILMVNLLDNLAEQYALPMISDQKMYALQRQGYVLEASGFTTEPIEHAQLVDNYFTVAQVNSTVNLQMVTPTTFRTDGQYALYPTAELIIKSAAARFGLLPVDVTVKDEQAINQMIRATRITGYHLHSAGYKIKGIRIPAFTGSVTLSMRGPLPMLRLFNMLMGALPYTGLGVKTSLGMGGVTLK